MAIEKVSPSKLITTTSQAYTKDAELVPLNPPESEKKLTALLNVDEIEIEEVEKIRQQYERKIPFKSKLKRGSPMAAGFLAFQLPTFRGICKFTSVLTLLISGFWLFLGVTQPDIVSQNLSLPENLPLPNVTGPPAAGGILNLTLSGRYSTANLYWGRIQNAQRYVLYGSKDNFTNPICNTTWYNCSAAFDNGKDYYFQLAGYNSLYGSGVRGTVQGPFRIDMFKFTYPEMGVLGYQCCFVVLAYLQRSFGPRVYGIAFTIGLSLCFLNSYLVRFTYHRIYVNGNMGALLSALMIFPIFRVRQHIVIALIIATLVILQVYTVEDDLMFPTPSFSYVWAVVEIICAAVLVIPMNWATVRATEATYLQFACVRSETSKLRQMQKQSDALLELTLPKDIITRLKTKNDDSDTITEIVRGMACCRNGGLELTVGCFGKGGGMLL
eukprot:Colp12_sorted_trinity150504_noHs@28226